MKGQTLIGGKSLFMGVSGEAMNEFKNVSFKYGVLPYPMVSPDQDGYYTLLGFAYTTFSIPNNVTDPDLSAAVLECMNSEAYRYSSPILYQTVFKSRFANEAIDEEMFDIIKANTYVDATRVFHSIFEASYGWKGTPVGMFRSEINTNTGTWT